MSVDNKKDIKQFTRKELEEMIEDYKIKLKELWI